MSSQPTQLLLHIDAGPEADQEEQAQLAQRLREHLLELEVDAVDQVRSGAAPAGAKGDAISLATLAVTIAPVALKALTDMLQSWLTRHERASVTIESGDTKLIMTGTPSPEPLRIIDAWVTRHKA